MSENYENNEYIIGQGFCTTKNNNYFGIFGMTFAKVSDVRNPCFLSVKFRSPKVQKVRNTRKVERPKISGKRMALINTYQWKSDNNKVQKHLQKFLGVKSMQRR